MLQFQSYIYELVGILQQSGHLSRVPLYTYVPLVNATTCDAGELLPSANGHEKQGSTPADPPVTMKSPLTS